MGGVELGKGEGGALTFKLICFCYVWNFTMRIHYFYNNHNNRKNFFKKVTKSKKHTNMYVYSSFKSYIRGMEN